MYFCALNQCRGEMDIENLDEIIDVLRSGGVIVFPTDTVWALGCSIEHESAAQRIWEIKTKKSDRSMLLMVKDIGMLKQYVPQLHPKIETLLAYHERPVTIIYDQVQNVPDTVKTSDGATPIRVVTDEFCKQLIDRLGVPIVASSANITDEPFPENFGQISSDILTKADYIVKMKQAEKAPGSPSMWIKMSPKGELIFLRR